MLAETFVEVDLSQLPQRFNRVQMMVRPPLRPTRVIEESVVALDVTRDVQIVAQLRKDAGRRRLCGFRGSGVRHKLRCGNWARVEPIFRSCIAGATYQDEDHSRGECCQRPRPERTPPPPPGSDRPASSARR